jgi:hypothetical protein
MPLDGTEEVTRALVRALERENPQLVLRHAMFEVRPPLTRVLPTRGARFAVKAFASLITKQEVIALVGVCSDSTRLMAQNADRVPLTGNRVYWVDEVPYFSPHGCVDYYVSEALGAYSGCQNALEQNALIYLCLLEKQHRAIHRLRRKAYEQEREFAVLLEAD